MPPEFPVKFVGVDELHAAFLDKAAHAAVAWCRVQGIRVKPFFGLSLPLRRAHAGEIGKSADCKAGPSEQLHFAVACSNTLRVSYPVLPSHSQGTTTSVEEIGIEPIQALKSEGLGGTRAFLHSTFLLEDTHD
jgi:hypothetical protein